MFKFQQFQAIPDSKNHLRVAQEIFLLILQWLKTFMRLSSFKNHAKKA